jgi:hypothetical protein
MGGSAPNEDAHEAFVTGNVGDGGGNIHRVDASNVHVTGPILRVDVSILRGGLPQAAVNGLKSPIYA